MLYTWLVLIVGLLIIGVLIIVVRAQKRALAQAALEEAALNRLLWAPPAAIPSAPQVTGTSADEREDHTTRLVTPPSAVTTSTSPSDDREAIADLIVYYAYGPGQVESETLIALRACGPGWHSLAAIAAYLPQPEVTENHRRVLLDLVSEGRVQQQMRWGLTEETRYAYQVVECPIENIPCRPTRRF